MGNGQEVDERKGPVTFDFGNNRIMVTGKRERVCLCKRWEREREEFCVWKVFLYSTLNFFQLYLFSNQLYFILLLIKHEATLHTYTRTHNSSEMQWAARSSDRKLWQHAVKAPVRHSDSSLQVCFWQRSERFSWLDGWRRECAWNEWVQYSSVFAELVNARLYSIL